ncbi:MAG TPA: YfiR family protein [Bryobacteraceae bacterium]|jgi:hypothetical protein
MALLGSSFKIVRHALPLLLAAASLAHAEGPVVDEYQIKAAFLFNFAKFVEWPAAAFKSVDEPFAICVLGHNPFGSALSDVVQGKTVANRPFIVREVSTIQQAGSCHILFVSSSEQRRVRSLMEELRGSTTLTVGETDDFGANGGVITFKLKDSRVRITINPGCAQRAQLRISSKLLSLAEVEKR